MGCVSHLLYEVDHAGFSVSHLPVKGQRLQAVIARKRAPCAEVHGAAGLGVAGHCFPPVCPLFELWRQRVWKYVLKWKNWKKTGRQSGRLACRNTSVLLFSCLLQGRGRTSDITHSICMWVMVCVCSPKGCFAFACAHSVNAYAYVYMYIPCGLHCLWVAMHIWISVLFTYIHLNSIVDTPL